MNKWMIFLAVCCYYAANLSAETFWQVTPTRETAPVVTADDAADDIAIWAHPTRPESSLILATDKRAGILIYDLKGKRLAFRSDLGVPNNIDLRQAVELAGKKRDLVVISNKTAGAVDLLEFDAKTLNFELLARAVVAKAGQKVYGVCLGVDATTGILHTFVSVKKDRVYHFSISETKRELSLKSHGPLPLILSTTEGCVVDDEHGQVYLAEEEVGVWKFDLQRARKGIPIAMLPFPNLAADLEGLAIYQAGPYAGHLIVSSQGNHSYALFDRETPHKYEGSFRIGANPSVDGATKTDGIEVSSVYLGADFPAGLFIAQDNENTDGPYLKAQNFKLVDWREIADHL